MKAVLAALKFAGAGVLKAFTWAMKRPTASLLIGLGALLVSARAKSKDRPVRAALAGAIGQAYLYTAIVGYLPGFFGWLFNDVKRPEPTPLEPGISQFVPPWHSWGSAVF